MTSAIVVSSTLTVTELEFVFQSNITKSKFKYFFWKTFKTSIENSGKSENFFWKRGIEANIDTSV